MRDVDFFAGRLLLRDRHQRGSATARTCTNGGHAVGARHQGRYGSHLGRCNQAATRSRPSAWPARSCTCGGRRWRRLVRIDAPRTVAIRSARGRPAARSLQRPAVLLEPDERSRRQGLRPVLDDTGLSIGSDTDRVPVSCAGRSRSSRSRVARPPPTDPYTLPGDLYNVPASSCQAVDASIRYRVNTGAPESKRWTAGSTGSADDSDGAPGAAFRNTGSNSVSPWDSGSAWTRASRQHASTIFDSSGRTRRPARDAMDLPGRLRKALQVRLFLINQVRRHIGRP